MPKTKNTIHTGEVLESLPNTMFRVRMDEDDRLVLATLKGTLRRSFVKILPGVRVKIEMTPYDNQRGRIVARI